MKIFDAATTQFQEAPLKLNPEDLNYEKLVASRTQRARNSIEYSNIAFNSVKWHVEAVGVKESESLEQTEDAVAKVFGIHKVPPKAKKVIGQKQEKESPKGTAVNESK